MSVLIKTVFSVTSRLSYKSLREVLNYNVIRTLTNESTEQTANQISKQIIDHQPEEVYDYCDSTTNYEDLSHLTPYFQKTFNIAAYVNKSESLQNLVKLGVNLSAIEKKPYLVEKFLRLDFERDMKPHICFLSDYVPNEDLGKYIGKNPMIFYESLEDLQVRMNYLLSKRFKNDQVKRIVHKNPFWLMFSTVRIDRRLGFFQQTFDLKGDEVRSLATAHPKIITNNLHHIRTNLFVIKEEMGFNEHEIKKLILKKPKLWRINQLSLIRRFNYIHNIMKIPHNDIFDCPELLLSREFRLKQRHLFLEKLGRAQYDPTKANYVPLIDLVTGTDVDFCMRCAKCTVNDFNTFLKTL